MVTAVINTRQAKPADAVHLAEVYEQAWLDAYRGVIPEIELRRAISKRGPAYWRRLAIRAPANNLVLVFDDQIAGYASFGTNRDHSLNVSGEIYEIYLAPEYRGVGLGRELFAAARHKLAETGLIDLCVWCLSDNDSAEAFYRQLGGRVIAAGHTRFGETPLRRTAYIWSDRGP